MKTIRNLLLAVLTLFPLSAEAQWHIGLGDTTFKVPIQAIESSDHETEKIDVGSLNCRRVKNGTDGACAGTSAEVSDANHPGLWTYTPGAGDLDTKGSLVIRFTATGMDVFRSVNQIGTTDVNLTHVNGVLVPNLYDGQLIDVDAATPGAGQTTIRLSSGRVIADNQFNFGNAIVVYDANGNQKAKACIFDSVNTNDDVVTEVDIAVLIAAGDNYNIVSESGCYATISPIQAFNNTDDSDGSVGGVSGNVVGSVGSVAGNVVGSVGSVAGNVVGSVGSVTGNVSGSVASVTGNVAGNVSGTINGLTAAALAQFLTTNTTKTSVDAIQGSVAQETADLGGGGGGGGAVTCTNLGDTWDALRSAHTDVGSFGEGTASVQGSCASIGAGGITAASYGVDVIGHVNTLQAVTVGTATLSASENLGINVLADNFSLFITSSTNGKWQQQCICGNSGTGGRTVALCAPFKVLPTGTVKYALIPDMNCNLKKYPTSH